MTMKYEKLSEFAKEFKSLAKRYRSLPDDLEEFKHILAVKPFGVSKHFNIITRQDGLYAIIKARLFCRYLKGSSLRIVYVYHETKEVIEFIEIYFKGKQKKEDHKRIKEYLKNF